MGTKFQIYFQLTVVVIINSLLNLCYGLDTSTIKPGNDLFAKRELKVENNSRKGYDPLPEFYRGPGSSSDRDRNRDKDKDTENNVIGLQRTHGFETRFVPKGSTNGYDSSNNRKGVGGITHERIGHYGPSSSEYIGGGSYAGEQQQIPYGYPQPIDFPSYGPTGYGGNGSPYEHHGLDLDYNKGGYGEYTSYGYPPAGGPPSDYYSDKIRFTKSFLIPLAGAAIIGLAAALISNPVLLPLGALSGALGKRRKRRDSNEAAQRLAYKGYMKDMNFSN